MIFDKDLDKSLSYILEENKSDNRDKIIKFLKGIPMELIEQIQTCLSSGEIDCSGEMLANDGTVYSFNIGIDEQEKQLTITQGFENVNDNDGLQVNFVVELDLVKEYPPYEPRMAEEMWIGNFEEIISFVGEGVDKLDLDKFMPFIAFSEGNVKSVGRERSMETEYYFVKTAVGPLVRSFNCTTGKREDTFIDESNIFEDISFEYIEKRYGGTQYTKKNNVLQND